MAEYLKKDCEGIRLWKRAIESIPGGNGLLSKRPERYLPDLWPTYYKKAEGIRITDLDGRTFLDFAQMGMGACILGYGDEDINQAVEIAVKDGPTCTLNSPLEVYLAEELLKLNSFAGGVRFAKTGGEAMAMAIRIARAKSNKEKVLFSGYHGWHDWYLSTNIRSSNNLDNHLLPGLSSVGVPKALRNSVYPFHYNNTEEFLELVNKVDDAGVVVIEGCRYDMPTVEFIETISEICEEKGIVFVIDEITSGFRLNENGAYSLYNIAPDIVVYGKALGSGYPISAIVGKKDVMDVAQDTFMSSSYWTEAVGFSAGLAFLQKMQKVSLWEHLVEIGDLIGAGWSKAAKETGLKTDITEVKPLVTFKLNYEDSDKLYTLFTQEMLQRGYLAASSVYVSLAHTRELVAEYLENVHEVFSLMVEAIEKDQLDERLKSRVRMTGFSRLT